MNRRQFLTRSSAFAVGALSARAATPSVTPAPDHKLRIEKGRFEIGPKTWVETFTYNGQIPGPTLRMKEGRLTTVEVTNATEYHDIVHWHGLATDSRNDGAMEEGSPMIPPGGSLLYTLTPRPAGTRWYHTHATAYANLELGTYSGQFGFLLIEGSSAPGSYDQEFNLAVHHWEPSFVPMVTKMREQSANTPMTSGSDVGYRYATINSHRLGFGEPLRVKQGQRVLLRLLNASATENVVLSLPGHSFKVIAMDGNPVPHPQTVEVLSLAVAERIDAIVEMNHPGVWILGSTLHEARAMGLGIVVEYEGAKGTPVWRDPASSRWDYTIFAGHGQPPRPDGTFDLTFRDIGTVNDSRFDTWTINDRSWPEIDPLLVQHGKRYRLAFHNGSGDQHPLHLHRHSFEVTKIGDSTLSGLMKDVVNIMPLQTIEVDFIADNPGDTLFHCHQQLHMDYGFMQLIRYSS